MDNESTIAKPIRLFLALLFCCVFSNQAIASVTLSQASGGNAILATTAGGAWTTLTGPAVAEGATGDIGVGTIVLTAPSGFEFDAGTMPTVLITRISGGGSGSRNINNQPSGTAQSTAVTSTTITFTINATTSNGVKNTLTWQNIRVRPTAQSPLASGNIVESGSSSMSGLSTTNWGLLQDVSPAPTVATGAATGITNSVAKLNGTVSSNGASSTVTFEYGLDASYGYSIVADQSPLPDNAANAAVSADLIGLNCNTVFHYRTVATNSAGTSYGADATLMTGACSSPYPATACSATRFGSDLSCVSNDVHLTQIALAPGSIIGSCVSGTPVTLDLDLTINFNSPSRWDIGIFIANDGKLPTVLPSNGGASSCSVDILPTTAPFLDLDGVPQGTSDTCGDGNGSINGGTGSGVKRMTGVTLPCYASPNSGGKMYVPFTISWDNQKSPIGGLCTSNAYPVPNTASKCNAPLNTVSLDVVVLPVISKSDGSTTVNPGASTTYTIVITNNSGGTLLDSVFKDPAVTNLTVNSVTCSPANGATCPAATVAAMQGAGIAIPSANLPNNGSLTFTVGATVANNAPVGSQIANTATVAIGSNVATATDTDTVVISPAATKSFAPNTITSGAASVLTVTLNNPTASDVTNVAFTDNYPAGLVNTSSASPSGTCGGTVSAANNGNSLALTGGTIPASGSCSVTVNVTSSAIGSYINSTGTITSSTGNISASSAILTVQAATYGAFNACDDLPDPDAACTSTTTVSTSHITTKVAGSPFTLDLVALKPDGSWNASYNGSVIVELLDSSDNSGALDANNCRSSWNTVIATLGYQPSFSGSNGQISILPSSGSFTVPEAYRDVRVRVRNVGGTTRIGCSTDNFSIRPDHFALSVTDFDWQTTGTFRALNNTDLASHVGSSTGTGYPIHKAGQPFTVSATARNAANVTTANYTGSPAVLLGACSGTACGSNLGIFSLSSAGFVSGVLSSTGTTYSEVGSFNLSLQDTGFTSVDSADTAAACTAGGRYICGSADVGRFVPDHFAVAQGTAIPACGTFTYFGQDGFTTGFTLTAQNAGNAATTNYSGSGSSTGWAKLPLTAWGAAPASESSPGYGFAVGASSPALPSGASLTASATAPTATNGNAWASGSATVTARHRILRPANPAAPTTVTVSVLPVDYDGVTMAAAANTAPGALLWYGRLELQNAYGSELLPLPMSLTAEYWAGGSWTINTQDSCTAVSVGSLALHLANAGSTTPAFVSPLISGNAQLVLSAPGASHTGYADLTINSPAWLDFNWKGAGDTDPTGRATFGIYQGNSRFIDIRELY